MCRLIHVIIIVQWHQPHMPVHVWLVPHGYEVIALNLVELLGLPDHKVNKMLT